MGTSDVTTMTTTTTAPFGRGLLKDFFLDEKYVNINHGSFGTYPKPVKAALHHFQDLAEARPDSFIRWDFQTHLRKSRALVADLLRAPYEACVFVSNATTGVNVILRNLSFDDGDVIVDFATTYGACKNTVSYVCDTTKATCARVQYTYPIEDDELVQQFRGVVEKEQAQGRRVRVAIFDTVTANPGVRMPFESLTQACRELGVMSLVDGAHGIGQVELNLTELDPDFFVSNCHKWLLTPRANAVFYCPVRNQHLMRSTLPTSWGMPPLPSAVGPHYPRGPHTPDDESAFEMNFGFIGSGDFAPYLCVPAALEYRASIGGEAAIREYCETLAREGGQAVARALGTEVLDNSTHTLTKCFFANVRLPISLAVCEELAAKAAAAADKTEGKKVVENGRVPATVRSWIEKTTEREYHSFQAAFEYRGGWWVRLSAMVYLDMADFERTAVVLREVSERAEGGEWL